MIEVMGLARDTGGYVFGVSSRPGYGDAIEFDAKNLDAFRKQISLITRQLNTRINGFYPLQLGALRREQKMSKVSLEIVDGRGKRRKDLTCEYQGLLPPQ